LPYADIVYIFCRVTRPAGMAGVIVLGGSPCLKSLFHTVVSSKASSTSNKYMYAFNRWKKWAQPLSTVDVFPAKPVHVALYL